MTCAIRFGPFRLDTANAQLFRGAREIQLRPKTYAILQYLAERPGRLLTKDELLDAIWPDVEVSDGALKVCMAELRKLLGDDAQQPKFIETAHRRGYRFIGKTSDRLPVTSDQLPVTSNQLPVTGELGQGPSTGLVTGHWSLITAPFCVGRAAERAELQRALERAFAGQRQVIFVTGEAGIGKTTLLNTFLHSALSTQDSGLLVAHGQCVEQYGPAEAYLPVLEGLGRLCRDPRGHRLVALLREHAPSWLMQLPGLLRPADREALQREYAGMSRDRMLRELVVGLEALTADTPMILSIDDLHWSDTATLDLLAALARRQEAARLLVIGTYRPIDALLGSHSLPSTVQQLTLRRQCTELPLEHLSVQGVAAYLETRFAGGNLSPALASMVHQNTAGNPLFMVNVTDHLVTLGLVDRSDGTWRLAADLAAVAREVPNSLRQMIDTQLDALGPDALRILEAASAAGVEFPAQAVAAALQITATAVEEACAGLLRRRVLQRTGTAEWPDSTAAARYAFTHALYQQALYERLTPARCAALHLRIAERLERGYGSQAGDIAAELAMHFERGKDAARAVGYYHQAGAAAVQRHAYQEAIVQLTKALTLLETLPASPERDQRELELQVTLGVPQLNTKGFAAAEVEHTYARALVLCRRIGETPQLFPVLEGLHSYYAIRGDLPIAYDLAQQLFRLGDAAQDRVQLLEAHHTLGCCEFWHGALAAARAHFEAAIALYDAREGATAFHHSGHDPRVCCLANLGVTLWFAGYPDQALQRVHDAVSWATQLNHPDSRALAHALTAWVQLLRGESAHAQASAEAAQALAREYGLPYWGAQATILRGSALARQGDAPHGEKQLDRGLSGYEAIGAGVARTEYLALRADLYARAGRHADGLAALDQALAVANRQGERYLEAEIYRLKGELVLQSESTVESQESRVRADDSNPQSAFRNPQSEAEEHFQRALDIARGQGAKSLELHAARSLSRLWSRQGKRQQAREQLAELYGWFSEGFDTVDLRQAKALLDDLRD